MNRNELGFAVFCIESIAEHLNMSGVDVYRLLTDESKILDEYILAYYDALHTQGREYIVNDIIECMMKEGLLE